MKIAREQSCKVLGASIGRWHDCREDGPVGDL